MPALEAPAGDTEGRSEHSRRQRHEPELGFRVTERFLGDYYTDECADIVESARE